ncbi:hypothetical protein NQ317_019177 [Molorchus minor]|uniref:Saposin B-type domain-containing protein n=1 Tax=Molorchus minor TaxID=1323400 RepID=A0ABQ9J5B2_9CUCU|nr:hypothetical protein NQ317_019177 [Molorchus minor]
MLLCSNRKNSVLEELPPTVCTRNDYDSNSMDLEVCTFCKDILTIYYNLVRSCEGTEETIRRYSEQRGTNSRGLVKLVNVMGLSNDDHSGCGISDKKYFIKYEETLPGDTTYEAEQIDERNEEAPKYGFLENFGL